MPELCVRCKGTKLLCGRKKCPLLEKARLLAGLKPERHMDAASPPSVFVGRVGYPKVFVGPMIAKDDNPEVLGSPENWSSKSLDEIARMMAKMIRTKELINVHQAKNPNRDLQDMQVAAMSKASVEMEVKFKKNPKAEVSWNDITTPHGLSGELEDFKLVENPRVPRKIDEVANDEMKATDALFYLYSHGIPISKLYNLLSIGVLGINRKLVPTRWSITATDDTIGKALIGKVKAYLEISDYLIFESYKYGNRYEILLIPGEWEFDNIEIYDPGCIWVTGGESPVIISDYEPYDGRKNYASNIEGAYYSARLGVLEYLEKIKKQAKVLVVREITPDYWIPVGVWQIRENVREAMKMKPMKFETLNDALKEVDRRLNVKGEWKKKSELLARIRSREALMRWIPRGK